MHEANLLFITVGIQIMRAHPIAMSINLFLIYRSDTFLPLVSLQIKFFW